VTKRNNSPLATQKTPRLTNPTSKPPHWSEYTRSGIEEAIGHFRQAIEFDPNYALAYAGIIDCFLRLATNYSPPEGVYLGEIPHDPTMNSYLLNESNRRVELRFEWDCKRVERELRRAIELKTVTLPRTNGTPPIE
jgi:hypothetical protein